MNAGCGIWGKHNVENGEALAWIANFDDWFLLSPPRLRVSYHLLFFLLVHQPRCHLLLRLLLIQIVRLIEEQHFSIPFFPLFHTLIFAFFLFFFVGKKEGRRKEREADIHSLFCNTMNEGGSVLEAEKEEKHKYMELLFYSRSLLLHLPAPCWYVPWSQSIVMISTEYQDFCSGSLHRIRQDFIGASHRFACTTRRADTRFRSFCDVYCCFRRIMKPWQNIWEIISKQRLISNNRLYPG